MKYAKRRDANEWAIVAALEAVGANVTRLDTTGVPDLLVAFRSRTFLLEVKDPAQAKRAYRGDRGAGRQPLTPAQVKWWGLPWSGDERRVVETVEEALAAIGYTGPVP